ncbi:MAG: hypothetical protein LC118_12450 [Dehalococcoidia bacterium]|nr:hypothetical protein [Dehalococcoidia bacterium]
MDRVKLHRKSDKLQGDTLEGLAGRYFAPLPRACGFWWVLADFQPDPIVDPTLELDVGRRLVVPSLRVLTDVNLNAVNVETSLAEILDAFEGDHFKGNEANAGQHRTIRVPPLGGTKALILDSDAAGSIGTRLRVYADTDTIWFVLNASWNGAAWARDNAGWYCGGFRFSRSDFAFLYEDTFAATFTTWTRTWRLPMGSAINSAFELTGNVRETGRLGMEITNSYNATRTVGGGGGVTFRSRFPAAPSSITLSLNTSGGFTGTPSVAYVDRDGFGFWSYQSLAAGSSAYWFGSYTAIA